MKWGKYSREETICGNMVIQFTKTPILQYCQVPNGFFGITVNFKIQKLKSKHLVCLGFLWWQVLLREREKIFYSYSGPLSLYRLALVKVIWSGSFLQINLPWAFAFKTKVIDHSTNLHSTDNIIVMKIPIMNALEPVVIWNFGSVLLI